MKIIYCHHAERKRDKTKPVEFWQEEDITELGEKDAKLFANMLQQQKIKISAVYTSPYKRCKKTAEIVNQFSSAPIIDEPRFNEFVSNSGETWVELQTRIMEALKDIIKKHDNAETILCVTSGVNISGFINLAYGIEPSPNAPFLGLISCSPIIFTFDKTKF